jgi:hypothetical protein
MVSSSSVAALFPFELRPPSTLIVSVPFDFSLDVFDFDEDDFP